MENLIRRVHIRLGRPGPGLLPALLATLVELAGLGGCSETKPLQPALKTEFPAPGTMRVVRFGKRLALTIQKPQNHVLNSEEGMTFEVHHIWRNQPASLKHDANLGIFIGRFALPHCPGVQSPGKAITPALARETGSRWRSCATSVPGQVAWEVFHAAGRHWVVHLFILGRATPRAESEMRVLQRIANTLKIP